MPLVMANLIVLAVLVFTTLVPPKVLVIEGGSKITMLAFAVPPLDAPRPPVFAVYVKEVVVGVLRTVKTCVAGLLL